MPTLFLSDAAATHALGAALGARLIAGDVVLLDGSLGAGKTTLVKGLVAGLGGDADAVASPTFTLLNRYDARLMIHHVDAYRLERPGELAGLGFHELSNDGVGVVEWAEKVAEAFDLATCWRIRIEPHAAGRRMIITPPADRPTAADDLAATATGPVVTIPADAQGRDPLVHEYLERFRTTCAYHLFSWPWLAIGVFTALIGAWIGNHLAGTPGAPPWTESVLVRTLHIHAGNPVGVLGGMAGAAALVAALGAFIHRKRASTAQEVWFGALVVAFLYLLLYDQLIFISVVSAGLCTVYLLAIAFRIVALLLGGRRGLRHETLSEPPDGWPLYTVLSGLVGAALGRPDRETWAITGDGGFQMTSQELMTLVADRIPVRIALLDNKKLGMIRQWQEIIYAGNYHSAHLPGPDGATPGRGALRPQSLAAMRKPHAQELGADIWGLGVILYAPNNAGGHIVGHDGDNEPAINTAARFDPATGDGIVILETGNDLLATRLAGEWVFWRTGHLDLLMVQMAIERIFRDLAIGWAVILVAAVVVGWRLRRSRKPAGAAASPHP